MSETMRTTDESETKQQTLDGGVLREDDSWHPPWSGPGVVLWHADSKTSFARIAAWTHRLDKEGLI